MPMTSVSSPTIRRLVTVLALVALGVATVDAVGHAVVVGTSLHQQPVRPHLAGHVTLKFSSAIEVELSRVFLVSKGEKYQALRIAAGNRPGELVVEVPALAEGDYALKYRVFAADGHLTEDVVRFRVSP
jgi:methionine-rich copper-binding protein CopC